MFMFLLVAILLLILLPLILNKITYVAKPLFNIFIVNKNKRYTYFIKFLVIKGKRKPDINLDRLEVFIDADNNVQISCSTKPSDLLKVGDGRKTKTLEHVIKHTNMYQDIFFMLRGANLLSSNTITSVTFILDTIYRDEFGRIQKSGTLRYVIDKSILDKIDWIYIAQDDFKKLLDELQENIS